MDAIEFLEVNCNRETRLGTYGRCRGTKGTDFFLTGGSAIRIMPTGKAQTPLKLTISANIHVPNGKRLEYVILPIAASSLIQNSIVAAIRAATSAIKDNEGFLENHFCLHTKALWFDGSKKILRLRELGSTETLMPILSFTQPDAVASGLRTPVATKAVALESVVRSGLNLSWYGKKVNFVSFGTPKKVVLFGETYKGFEQAVEGVYSTLLSGPIMDSTDMATFTVIPKMKPEHTLPYRRALWTWYDSATRHHGLPTKIPFPSSGADSWWDRLGATATPPKAPPPAVNADED